MRLPPGWIQPNSRRLRRGVTGFVPGRLHEAIKTLFETQSDGQIVQVLTQRTLFGYYEKGLTRTQSQRWKELLLGESKLFAFRSQCNVPLVHWSEGLRWCSECFSEDQAAGKLSTWNTLHQIPYVHHCNVHFTPLLSKCANCNSPLNQGASDCLPGDSCQRCGAISFNGHTIPLSIGYLRLLDSSKKMSAAVDEYRPVAWHHFCEMVLSFTGGIRSAAEALEGAINEQWSVNSFREVFEALHIPFKAISENSGPSLNLNAPSMLEKLLAVGALDGFKRQYPHAKTPRDKLNPAEIIASEKKSGQSVRDALLDSVITEALPTELVDDILGGLSLPGLKLKYSLHARMYNRVLSNLPREVAAEVDDIRAQASVRKLSCRTGKSILRGMSGSHKLALYQSLLQELISSYPHLSRRQLSRLARIPYGYVFLWNQGWFDTRLPKKNTEYLRRIEERHCAEAIRFLGNVTAERKCSESSLSEFARSHRTSYCWLLSHKSEWLKNLFNP